MLFAAIINLGEPSLRKTGESADGLKRRPSLVAWGFRTRYPTGRTGPLLQRPTSGFQTIRQEPRRRHLSAWRDFQPGAHDDAQF